MTSDDHHFLDVLSGISNDIRKFTGDIADATDRHVDQVASSLRERLASQTWIPSNPFVRPPPPPPPPASIFRDPVGLVLWARGWVSRHRAITAAVLAFFGTSSFLVWSQKKAYSRKRRAKRASNGARTEVVVIAGPANSPITKSIALDLERRGFVVYVIVSSAEEEQIVKSEAKADIRPLNLDIVDSLHTQEAVRQFHDYLRSPQSAFPGTAGTYHLHFAGLLLVPDLIYPTGPVETIPPELWSDALNAKVLSTIATAQAFLPLIARCGARVLVLAPSIVSALHPAFHGVEGAVVGALDGFTAALRSELATLGIPVCQLRLGTFDCSTVGPRNLLQTAATDRLYAWPSPARARYGENFVAQEARVAGRRSLVFGQHGSAARGSPLRELHNAVFDALTVRRPREVWRVGRGSVAYDLVGHWLPRGLVGWMLGVRRVVREDVGEVEEEGPRLEDSVSGGAGDGGGGGGEWETVHVEG